MVNQLSPKEQLVAWLNAFDKALQERDIASAVNMFTPDGFWRDLIAFTWNITTMEGRQHMAEMLEANLDIIKPCNWILKEEAKQVDEYIEGLVEFETATCRGEGILRLNLEGQAWTLLTTSYELKGFEEAKGKKRLSGVDHGGYRGRKTWLQMRQQEQEELGYSRQPYCVIIGGGQGGIALAARLKQLNVPTLIIEKNKCPGDSWRNRYSSLCLHDPVWYDHLPYIPFPEHWPIFSPKDKLGDWLEMYTRVMELNYWGSSMCRQAKYDEQRQCWQVRVEKDGEDILLEPKQLVMATGMAGFANIPEIPGYELFQGDLHHSSRHPGAAPYKGKKAVVIGSNTSAHDICADFWEHGVDVTMVQRSTTCVIKSETLLQQGFSELYSEQAVANGIDTHKADLLMASVPYRLMPEQQKSLYKKINEQDSTFYKRLSEAGFLLDFGEDESGLFCKYIRRGSGYYIDVGASELVMKGEIQLKTGHIDQITANGLIMTDGSEIEADVIVFATGYLSMNLWLAELMGQEMADRVGKVWGVGSDTHMDPGPWEGELRNMWKPTQQEGLWFHGGNLHQSRHYSIYLALQLKARMEGLPTPVYGLQPSYHKS